MEKEILVQKEIVVQKSGIENHIHTVLLAAITALVLGLGGFIWNINGTIISMKVESEFRYEAITDANKKLNEIQTDIKSIEKRVQQLESKQFKN